jgi:hypothetical protein
MPAFAGMTVEGTVQFDQGLCLADARLTGFLAFLLRQGFGGQVAGMTIAFAEILTGALGSVKQRWNGFESLDNP